MARYIRDVLTNEYKWIDDEPGVKFSKPLEKKTRRGPYVVPDIEPFVSPIDGKVVSGRVQKRDHMKRHDVEELGDQKAKPRKFVDMPPAGPVVAEELKRRGIIG